MKGTRPGAPVASKSAPSVDGWGDAPSAAAPKSLRTPRATSADPVSQAGFLVLLIFVFCSACRVFDFVLIGLHIPMILSVIAAAFTLLGGGLQAAFRTRVGKLMCLFTVWIIVCIPFSSWKGGSFALLQETWSKTFLVFLMVAGSATSLVRVRQMTTAIALGAGTAGALGVWLGYRSYERLSLPGGYLSNANDFAQVLLVGMCFLPVILANSKSIVRRIIVAIGTVFFLYVILSTGSRAALLTAVLVAALVALHASPMRKVAFVAAFLAIGLGALVLAPRAMRDRLATLLGGDQEDMTTLQQVAVDSAAGRKDMLIDSIILTLKHPLFGVGPGQFQSAEAAYTHTQGKRALWLETHNAYTQVSSETGIPGLLIFGAAVWTCLVGLARFRKIARKNPRLQAMYGIVNPLWLGFLAFAVTSFFSSVAYQVYFSLLLGLSAAAIAASERELSQPREKKSAEGAPAMSPRDVTPPSGAYVGIRG